MPRSTTLLRPLAAAALATVAPASELVLRDVGVGVRYLMQGYDYTLADPSGDRSGTEGFDTGYEVLAGARWAWVGAGRSHGPYAGGEVAYTVRESDATTLTTYGVTALGGWAVALSDRWLVRVEGRLGYGAGDLEVDGGASFSAVSGSGDWYGLGAAAGVSFALTDRLHLGLDVGYDLETGSYDLDGLDTDLEVAGLRLALGLTWRWSIAPRPLE